MPRQTKRFCRFCEKIKSIRLFGHSILSKTYCLRCQYDMYHSKRDDWEYDGKCTECGQQRDMMQLNARGSVCDDCKRKKATAQSKVQYALKHGTLQRKDICESCKINPALHLHHPDYNKPLEVISLCRRCHFWTHSNMERQRDGKKPIPLEYW